MSFLSSYWNLCAVKITTPQVKANFLLLFINESKRNFFLVSNISWAFSHEVEKRFFEKKKTADDFLIWPEMAMHLLHWTYRSAFRARYSLIDTATVFEISASNLQWIASVWKCQDRENRKNERKLINSLLKKHFNGSLSLKVTARHSRGCELFAMKFQMYAACRLTLVIKRVEETRWNTRRQKRETLS